MVKVLVKYNGLIQSATGKKLEEISINSHTTLEDLINILTSTYGEKFANYMKDGNVFIDRNDSFEQLLNKEYLTDDSTILFTGPIIGG